MAKQNCSRRHSNFFFVFLRKQVLTYHVNHLPSRWFTWNVRTYFLWKIIIIKKIFKKCHLLQLWLALSGLDWLHCISSNHAKWHLRNTIAPWQYCIHKDIFTINSVGQALTNSVDPDQRQQNVASDQGMHCLPFIQQYVDVDTASSHKTDFSQILASQWKASKTL